MKTKNSVRIGVTSMFLNRKEEKINGDCFDRFFDFCESHLPGCGCDVVLLPEQFESHPKDRQPLAGPIARGFAAFAKRNKLYLIAPLAEKRGGRAFNAQAVFSPAGKIIHVYRKVHLAPGEEKVHNPGRGFKTFNLPWFKAGIVTCFDNQFPESTRAVAVLGAQVVFLPSFGDLHKPHRDAARCLDNHIYLAGSSVMDMTCNLPATRFEEGMVLDPLARLVASTHHKEGLAVAELPLKNGKLNRELSKNSLSARVDYIKRRRPSAYGPLVSRV